MAYTIHYGPVAKNKKKSKRKYIMVTVAVTGFLVLLTTSIRKYLWELLIPGKSEITTAAISNLIQDIQHGTPLANAIEAFCRHILAYA